MIYAAYIVSEDDKLADAAFDIAWPYLVGSGYEDCVSHQVAVTSYINHLLECGVRNRLVIANRAIAMFVAAKARFSASPAPTPARDT